MVAAAGHIDEVVVADVLDDGMEVIDCASALSCCKTIESRRLMDEFSGAKIDANVSEIFVRCTMSVCG